MVMKKALPVGLFAVVLLSVIGMAPVSPVRAATAMADAEGLTDDTLKQMLLGMGIEPKPLSKGFLVAIKQDTWTINMQLVISADKSKLGFNANLGKVDAPDTVTATQWRALLISNGDIDPSSFYFDMEQKKLYLHRSLDNRAITPVFLRGQIDNFVANVRGTADLWKFTK